MLPVNPFPLYSILPIRPQTQPFFLPGVYAFMRAAAICPQGEAMAADGLVNIRSHNGPHETRNRLEAEVKARGMTVFAHIDHAAGAAAAGLPLRPTDLLIFGTARAGTPLMESVQTMGIDLPLKALVWQDVACNTWVSYNDPAWLARRHGLDPETDATTAAMSAMLDAIAKAAAG
jgi:uncharacterized protein (DUF302 family)